MCYPSSLRNGWVDDCKYVPAILNVDDDTTSYITFGELTSEYRWSKKCNCLWNKNLVEHEYVNKKLITAVNTTVHVNNRIGYGLLLPATTEQLIN